MSDKIAELRKEVQSAEGGPQKHRVHSIRNCWTVGRFAKSRPAVERMTQMRKPAQPGARRRSQAKGAVWERCVSEWLKRLKAAEY